MSRLIVKNLPKIITEEKLRELFNPNGTITDVQLKYTKDGIFRQFAFVGYRGENEAEQAVEALNNTFINTRKITVEKCAVLGDVQKPRAWSKYASDSSAFKRGKKKDVADDVEPDQQQQPNEDGVKTILEKYKNEPMFEEFLQLHAKDKVETLKELATTRDGVEEKLANQPITDDEYLKSVQKEKPKKEKLQLYHLKIRDLPYKIKKRDIRELFRKNIPFSIRIPRNTAGIVFVGFKTERGYKKALTKDKSFIKGKQIRIVSMNEKNNNSDENKNNKWKTQEEALKNEEGIAESGRIFIRNLSYTTVEADLEQLFAKYGELTEVNMPIDSLTKQPKGFAIVTFMFPEHAVRAYSELDGSILHGRLMHLLPGKAKEQPKQADDETGFKQKKIIKQKSLAANAHNWNTLFLGHDAVAEAIAKANEVSKEAVIGPDASGSAAVRLAMGETQIVAETRKYLEDQGVVVDVFNQTPKGRSKTVILVKNLPSKTNNKEIREIFEPHGELGRVILPPSGISALVEFLEPTEARKAFLRVAYSKFKNLPLYLEWAPQDSLKDPKQLPAPIPVDEKPEEDEEIEAEPDTTLFVKNLNFQTTDKPLKAHFEGCGKVKYATVATKKDLNNPGSTLSMGYGFVQFYQKSHADKALKTLQLSVLDGKSLELKRSERTLKIDEATQGRKRVKMTKQTGSKILVRNVPFQANKKDIAELFTVFGQIKALRMPQKMTPGAEKHHRGFAFIDYATSTDAKAAFEALCQSTHLFGRRLVLEWATTEEEVSDIRKRTAEHFGKVAETKKSKKSVLNID